MSRWLKILFIEVICLRFLTNHKMSFFRDVEQTKKITIYINKWHRKQCGLLCFFLCHAWCVPLEFHLRGPMVEMCLTLNLWDWKIQQEIMRSDLPELWCWWNAWGYHEHSKKGKAASGSDKSYIHNKHIKSNLFDCCQPLCVLYYGMLTSTWPK